MSRRYRDFSRNKPRKRSRPRKKKTTWLAIIIAIVLFAAVYYLSNSEGINNYLTLWVKDIEEQSAKSNIQNAKKAFGRINELRQEHGVGEIEWDERIYELGMYKVNDMGERGYFDHKDPDGKCIGSYASEFGLSYPEDTFAENAFGGGGYMAAVKSWQFSRGHRFNMLHPDHVRGAISCDRGNCVFIGQGGSGWICATGEEGLAYWETAPKQLGEA